MTENGKNHFRKNEQDDQDTMDNNIQFSLQIQYYILKECWGSNQIFTKKMNDYLCWWKMNLLLVSKKWFNYIKHHLFKSFNFSFKCPMIHDTVNGNPFSIFSNNRPIKLYITSYNIITLLKKDKNTTFFSDLTHLVLDLNSILEKNDLDILFKNIQNLKTLKIRIAPRPTVLHRSSTNSIDEDILQFEQEEEIDDQDDNSENNDNDNNNNNNNDIESQIQNNLEVTDNDQDKHSHSHLKIFEYLSSKQQDLKIKSLKIMGIRLNQYKLKLFNQLQLDQLEKFSIDNYQDNGFFFQLLPIICRSKHLKYLNLRGNISLFFEPETNCFKTNSMECLSMIQENLKELETFIVDIEDEYYSRDVNNDLEFNDIQEPFSNNSNNNENNNDPYFNFHSYINRNSNLKNIGIGFYQPISQSSRELYKYLMSGNTSITRLELSIYSPTFPLSNFIKTLSLLSGHRSAVTKDSIGPLINSDGYKNVENLYLIAFKPDINPLLIASCQARYLVLRTFNREDKQLPQFFTSIQDNHSIKCFEWYVSNNNLEPLSKLIHIIANHPSIQYASYIFFFIEKTPNFIRCYKECINNLQQIIKQGNMIIWYEYEPRGDKGYNDFIVKMLKL
ncbi:hypothetical protein CYY_004107 [Polysphondylium violaceum]|uniref:Uncharacterized protein n=1 Tax=Polysphondylium violaceum TaxID=133409 RepID=A0A8J4PWQ7_9MYCE|nr:hypothetical protein CYY_004107 [Polysphondylium violaceum]